MSVRVEAGDCRQIIPTLGVTVDAVVCDPPYDLVAMTKRFGKSHAAAKSPDHQRFARGFMGRNWDGEGVAFDPETWRIISSVLRPGGIILAFGAPRTHHRLASAIEDAGFVIQDCLMWLFATGFPKRRDMLKPAYEPIVVAYKPGGARTLQVDECRISCDDKAWGSGNRDSWREAEGRTDRQRHRYNEPDQNPSGRWPANICHDGSDEVVSAFPASAGQQGDIRGTEASATGDHGIYGHFERRSFAARGKQPGGFGNIGAERGDPAPNGPMYSDSGSAARFFFSAKAGAQDRWGSKHPTVKPVELMKWLVALVTPPGGIVLDPFAGSGTTAVAALATGRDCILIDRLAKASGDPVFLAKGDPGLKSGLFFTKNDDEPGSTESDFGRPSAFPAVCRRCPRIVMSLAWEHGWGDRPLFGPCGQPTTYGCGHDRVAPFGNGFEAAISEAVRFTWRAESAA